MERELTGHARLVVVGGLVVLAALGATIASHTTTTTRIMIPPRPPLTEQSHTEHGRAVLEATNPDWLRTACRYYLEDERTLADKASANPKMTTRLPSFAVTKCVFFLEDEDSRVFQWHSQ